MKALISFLVVRYNNKLTAIRLLSLKNSANPGPCPELISAASGFTRKQTGKHRFFHLLCLAFPDKAPLPLLQREQQGCGADQVLPRLLHQMHQDQVRDAAAQVSKVQRRVRRQRLPPHLHRVKADPRKDRERSSSIRSIQPHVPRTAAGARNAARGGRAAPWNLSWLRNGSWSNLLPFVFCQVFASALLRHWFEKQNLLPLIFETATSFFSTNFRDLWIQISCAAANTRGGSRWAIGAILPRKPTKIKFIYHNFVQFWKQVSRQYETLLPNILEIAPTPPTLPAGSAPWPTLGSFVIYFVLPSSRVVTKMGFKPRRFRLADETVTPLRGACNWRQDQGFPPRCFLLSKTRRVDFWKIDHEFTDSRLRNASFSFTI